MCIYLYLLIYILIYIQYNILSKLITAAFSGDLPTLQRLLENQVNANAKVCNCSLLYGICYNINCAYLCAFFNFKINV